MESQREAKPLLNKYFPPLILKERGIKGVRLENNLFTKKLDLNWARWYY
jgi:hypothetical protein